jgi:manganese efflux pump family protein
LSFPELCLFSLALSMDCFAVSFMFGSSRILTWKDILRMSFMFGLFQGAMPIAGWMVGSSLLWLIKPVDHWIAFAILAFIGTKMIWQSLRNEEQNNTLDIRNFSVLISLSVATSIDALITGVSFGFIRVNILEAVSIIAAVTFLVTLTGARLGRRITFLSARWTELAGGLVLIAIGIKILVEHLTAT